MSSAVLRQGARPPATVLLVNPKAGCSLKPGYLDKLITAGRTAGALDVHLLGESEDLSSVVKQKVDAGARIIAVAGGDGTISSVANVLAGSEVGLLPIPFGTLNHFCQDVGTDPDPLKSIRAVAPELARERWIDLGQVNSRYFVNNSSLGLYPHLVKQRQQWQHALGKWMAYAVAMFEFVRHPVRVRVQLKMEEGGQPFHAGLIFVANNAIEPGVWSLGKRSRLDEGFLQLFVLKHGTVWATFRAAVAFLRGNIAESPVINEHRLKCFDVLVKHRKQVRVSYDGETIVLRPPIRYQVVPRALKVITYHAADEQAQQSG